MRTRTVTEREFPPLTELLAPSRLQPINLRVKASLVAEARRHDVNISEVLNRALLEHLRQLRRERWLGDAFAAIHAYNVRVETEGLLLDALSSDRSDE
jgi:post-segregation antitoxin (ccd killing protein)